MADQETAEHFMFASEVASKLGVSIRTLSRWGRLRKGPPRVKVGRTILYRRSAYDAWLMRLEEGFGSLVQPVAVRGGRRDNR